ncbi:hypothetical protein REH65_24870 [Saccharopolyspora sp. ID03-671]|uniref:hypothetical protein n=1 Tax=Saccharopolyspora sp. ID03-671 TaxID=3073066 RepID=UPI0032503650
MNTHRHETTHPTDTPTNAPVSCPTGTQEHASDHALPDDWWTAGGYDTNNGRIEYDWRQQYWRAVLPDGSSVVLPAEAQAVAYLDAHGPAVVRDLFRS